MHVWQYSGNKYNEKREKTQILCGLSYSKNGFATSFYQPYISTNTYNKEIRIEFIITYKLGLTNQQQSLFINQINFQQKCFENFLQYFLHENFKVDFPSMYVLRMWQIWKFFLQAITLINHLEFRKSVMLIMYLCVLLVVLDILHLTLLLQPVICQ